MATARFALVAQSRHAFIVGWTTSVRPCWMACDSSSATNTSSAASAAPPRSTAATFATYAATASGASTGRRPTEASVAHAASSSALMVA